RLPVVVGPARLQTRRRRTDATLRGGRVRPVAQLFHPRLRLGHGLLGGQQRLVGLLIGVLLVGFLGPSQPQTGRGQRRFGRGQVGGGHAALDAGQIGRGGRQRRLGRPQRCLVRRQFGGRRPGPQSVERG